MGAPPRSGKGGRKGLLVGGGVVGLALVGGAAWAAMSFFSTGAQPAEALPASTLGYASIDLDPSGGQKIEALRTLNKFPAFEDAVGIDSDEDLRQGIFDLIQEGDACPGLDFGDDIDPWLGDRAAVAAVEDSEGSVQPVVVVQVKDATAAQSGLEAITACAAGEGGSGAEDTGWVIEGDWAVVAPTEALAETVSDDAAENNLADDETFQKWTGETGEAGVVTMYAAPGAGAAILQQLGDAGGLPEQARGQFEDFKGAAATMRFSDGSLELEAAGGAPADAAGLVGASSISDRVGNLPDDTAAVIGLSFGEGWVQAALDQFADGTGSSTDELLTEFETATGLSLPEDIETLTGEGVVLSVGPGLDAEELANSADPTQVPVAITLSGDPAEIEEVVGKLTAQIPDGEELIGSTIEGDTVVLGPDGAYRDEVAAGGSLGNAEEFTRVVPEGDSPVVFYVSVDSFESSLETLLSGDDEVLQNVRPLSSIGVSTSVDGDVSRFVMRIATDD